MKKQELIDKVASVTGQPKVLVRSVLNATSDVVAVTLPNEPVFLMGLGKLSAVQRGEKQARNLHTGEPVVVPARTVVHFAPSTGLTNAVNPK